MRNQGLRWIRRAMGRMTVSLDGVELIRWEDAETELRLIESRLRDVSGRLQVNLGAIAEIAFRALGGEAPVLDAGDSEVRMWLVGYFLLTSPTGNDGFPGRWRDHLSAWDMDFRIAALDCERSPGGQVMQIIPSSWN